jgi:hypothetical protein
MCVIDANQDGNASFSAAPQQQQSFTIAAALTAQAITFTSSPPAAATVGGSYTVAATGGGSGNPVVFSIDASSAAGACSIAADVVSLTGPGMCVIDANQDGNASFSAAPQQQQSFTIAAANPVQAQLTALLNSVESANIPPLLRTILADVLMAALHDLGATPAGGATAGPVQLTAFASQSSSQPAGTRGSDHSHTEAACRDLELFVFIVEVSRRQIPASLRDQWISSARAIEASLGCGCSLLFGDQSPCSNRRGFNGIAGFGGVFGHERADLGRRDPARSRG